ncbi:hypothetical protein ARSEF4850_006118 [Beauveria asiatica]
MATSILGSIIDWRVFAPIGVHTVVWSLVAIISLTYITTSLQGAKAARKASGGSEPPTLPYAVPVLGHLPEFLWSAENFLRKATLRYGRDIPVRLRLINRRMSLLKGPGNVRTLFKSSRDVNNEQWLVQVLVNAFGVEATDAPFYYVDYNTGINNRPDPDSNHVSPEHRIFYLVYRSVRNGLGGARLEEMQRQLVHNLSSQITQAAIGSDVWTEMPDIYASFIRSITFRAAITSLCGPHVLKVAPTFEEDFWAFDSHLPNLFREMPAWLVPASFKARDKMKSHIAKWQAFAHENYDVNGGEADPRDWEDMFGSRLMRTRHHFFQRMPLSKSTLAADDLGLIWAATANAIPAVGWMMLEVLQRPALLAQVREEIAPFISWDGSGQEQMIVDIDHLCSQPLVQSIYAEVLRFHNGTVINRVPRVPTLNIGGWHFRKDEPIIISTYDTARDPTVWNQGPSDDAHPVDEFWPERFIVDPANALDGPVLAQAKAQSQNMEENEVAGSGRRFTMDGTDGSWVPYGGGTRMCPGRHFAKKEMIVTMAMFLTAFDLELLDVAPGGIQNDLSYFMFGVMHPKGAVRAKMRRRSAQQA